MKLIKYLVDRIFELIGHQSTIKPIQSQRGKEILLDRDKTNNLINTINGKHSNIKTN